MKYFEKKKLLKKCGKNYVKVGVGKMKIKIEVNMRFSENIIWRRDDIFGYINRCVSIDPQIGFIRAGVSPICNRVGFSMDRMSTEKFLSLWMLL